MTTLDAVRATKTPRDAILVLAQAIDAINARLDAAGDGWDEPFEWEPIAASAPPFVDDGLGLVTIVHDADTGAVTYQFPMPSDDRMDARRMLERQQLKIATALGAEAGDTDWTETYAKGGPWWLYQHRRDLVMGYDYTIRQQMVADVEIDSPKLAYEMSLDVLKQPTTAPDVEGGSGALAVGWVTGKGAKP